MEARTESYAEAVLDLSKKLGALEFDEFQLTSGESSSYYFDGRLVTLEPEGAYTVGKAFLPMIVSSGAEIVAGPAVGAISVVSAIGVVSFIEGTPVPGLIVRSEAKQHGAKKMIEGTVRRGAKVAVVDDTCSTGGSLIHAINAVEQAGCEVVKALCILDRNMGGSAEIRRRGYDFQALLEASEDGTIVAIGGQGG